MKKLTLLLLLILSTFCFGQTTLTNKLKINAATKNNDATRVMVQDSLTKEVHWILKENFPLPQEYARLSTGLLKNGTLSINADPTKYNITAGVGVISNFDDPENPTSQIVNFPAVTGKIPAYLNTGIITYVAIKLDGTVQESSTPFTNQQRRDLIILGAVVHSNFTNINVVNNISAPSEAIGNQLHDFIEAVGVLNLTGNKYSANGTNLSLNKSAGTIFKLGVNFANDWKNPHTLAQSGNTLLTFRYRFQGGNELADATVLNPTIYDVGNVSTTVPNNKFTIQTVTMFQTGLTRIQLGQNVYDTMAEAEAALFTRNYVVESNIATNGITRAYIIIKKECTSLQNTAEAKIIESTKFGSTASGGVALTLANIVTALGYTPENVANKSDSYTASSSTTFSSTKALVDGLTTTRSIKSNESLSLAQRKGDILYGIIDQFTGEEISLSKVVGTPTVDNVIYFQLGAEYFKRNGSEVIDLRWFRADNILVQSMLSYSNVKYLVSRDFDLNGAAITIPSGCTLVFKNGAFTNFASITGDFTKIEAGVNKIFDLSGTVSGFTVSEAYPEWFGAFGNNVNNDYQPFQKCLTSFRKLYLSAKNYYVAGNLTATQEVMIVGKGPNTVVTAGTTGVFLTLGDDIYLSDLNLGYYKNIISNFTITAEPSVTTVIKSKGIRWVNYDLLTVGGGEVGIHIIGAFKLSSLVKVDLPHQTVTGCIIDYTNNFLLDQVGIFGSLSGAKGLKIMSASGQQCKNITLKSCDFEGLSEAINVKGYDISNINILDSWFEGNTTDLTLDNSLETITSVNIDGGYFQGNIYLGTVDQVGAAKLINGISINNIQIENGDIYVRGGRTVQDCTFGSAISFSGSGSIIYTDAPHLINPGFGGDLPAHEVMPRYKVQPDVAVSTSEVKGSQGEIRYNDNEASIKTSKGWGFLPLLYKEELSFEALPDTSTIALDGVSVGSFVGTTDLYNFTGEIQGHIYTLVGGVGCNKLIVHSDPAIKLRDSSNVRILEGDVISFLCVGSSSVKEIYRNIASDNSVLGGSYTPTLTGTSNVSSISLSNASYTKVGDIVHVSVGYSLVPTATNTSTSFTISKPFNRANTDSKLVGVSSLQAIVSGQSGIITSVNSDKVTVNLLPQTNSNIAGVAVFQYNVTD